MSYGLGFWLDDSTGTVSLLGGDAGVGFVSTHHRGHRFTSTVLCNQTRGDGRSVSASTNCSPQVRFRAELVALEIDSGRARRTRHEPDCLQGRPAGAHRLVAAELPLMMLCGLLGVPLEDRFLLFDWTNRLTAVESQDDFRRATEEMNRYCLEHSAAKRAQPTDDIWSTLVNAELPPDDADGATRPSDEDLILLWQLLVIAGNETTRNAISGGVLALVEHRDQAILLYEQPDLMPTAVEEILRWVSPVNHFRRTATEDVELGGKQIRAGDKVVVYYASANRDEDVFTDPFTFDVTRQPNPHLAFGAGPHFCLGAPLARLQLRTILGELIPRSPRSTIIGPVERVPITFLAGIKSMPVRLVA